MPNTPHIEAALFRHLLANSATPLVGSILGGLLVGAAHLDSNYRELVLWWMLALFVATAVRIFLLRRCKAKFKKNGYIHTEAIKYAMTTAFSGLVWGMGGLLILEASPMAMVVSIIAAQAMIMGGALTLAAYLPAFYAFSLPAILPLIVVLTLQDGNANTVLAIHSTIFLGLIFYISQKFNHSLREVWKLSAEKERLLEQLTKANDHQKALANTDGLTAIANRRRFDDVFAQELHRSAHRPSPLSLLMLDVDHFKSYNDNYGHVAGDECLKQIAAVLRQHFTRNSDLVARYGGEEFAVILPHTDEAGAVQQAQAVRQKMAQLNMPHAHSPTASYVTLSIGVVSVYDAQTYTPQALVAMADECLYRAKANGRNQVVATVCGKAEAAPAPAAADAAVNL